MTNPETIPETVVFTFMFKPETNGGEFYGNVHPMQALAILQNLVVGYMAKQMSENGGKADEAARVNPEPET